MFEVKNGGFVAATPSGSFGFAEAISDRATAPIANPSAQGPASWRARLATMDWVPDLGENIGSVRWFRGLATMTVLIVGAASFFPEIGPAYGAQGVVPSAAEFDEARAQMIMPIALGSDSGRRMAATDSVVALAGNPERPSIEMTATLGSGDSFARVLERAGVGGGEASRIASMISGATSLSEIEAGTPIEIVLGKRTAKDAPRSLESLSFRARFDLNLAVNRNGNALRLVRQPIAVDDTPLRIRGVVGTSLYRSARAAGAPAEIIQDYLKIIAGRTALANIRPNDEFDIIIEHRRAETGEVRMGDLLFAGVDSDGKAKIQMLKWTIGDNTQWFEASGVGESRGQISRPVNGPVTSTFGMRRHPILGYKRMHSGLDFQAAHGTPIYAVTDGVISFAGRKGGYGNFIQINHNGGLASGYGHMSRFAARYGQNVRRGQIIGYVGSTGLSTGPHLHYELYRGGHPINPLSVKFTSRAQLAGADLTNFRNRLNRLKSVKPGAAMAPVQQSRSTNDQPVREIDRLSQRIDTGKARG